MTASETKPKLSWGRMLRISLLVVVVGWIIARIAMPYQPTLFSGLRPDNLGVREGQLAPCPATPNCVSSQTEDSEHYIAPLVENEAIADAWLQLKAILAGWEGAEIVAETDRYLDAEFASRWLGFVDDVEFVLSEDNHRIDVRSASRQGESDLGVNRKRIETLRSQLQGPPHNFIQ